MVRTDPAGLDWSTSAGMTSDWLTGGGPDTRTFGPGSSPVNEMKHAPGVDAARDYYNQKNKDNMDCDCKNAKAVTNFAAKFGLSGYVKAGLNPTQQFVGSYRIDIYPLSKCKKVFLLTNTSSFKSLTYGVGPAWNRSSFGPGGNMTQYYWWIE